MTPEGCDCPYCRPYTVRPNRDPAVLGTEWAMNKAGIGHARGKPIVFPLDHEPCACQRQPDAVIQNDGHATGCIWSRAYFRGGREEELDDF